MAVGSSGAGGQVAVPRPPASEVGVPAWIRGRLRPESMASRFAYQTFFKHGSTYMATCMVVAVFGGIAYDEVMNGIWTSNNAGVRHLPPRRHAPSPMLRASGELSVWRFARSQRQWKDVKDRLVESDD